MTAISPRRVRLVAPLLVVVVLAAVSTAAVPSDAQSSDETCANAERIGGQVAALQDERMDLSAQAETANYELSQIEDQVAEAEGDVAEAQAEADRTRAELRTYSIGAYVSGNGISSFDAIVRSEPDDAPQRQGYMEAAAGNGRDVIDRATAAEAKAAESVETLEGLQGEAEAKAGELEAARDEAEAAADAQAALYDEVQSECVALVNAEAARVAAAAAEAEAAAAAATATTAGPVAGPCAGARATAVGWWRRRGHPLRHEQGRLPVRVGRRGPERLRLLGPDGVGIPPGRDLPAPLQRVAVLDDHPRLPGPARPR